MSTSRSYPAHPYLGVSALIRHGEHIVLIERGKPPLEGIWSLPGGVVETGELLVDAIKREVLEEVGLEFEPLDASELVEVLRHDQNDRCMRHFVIAVFSGKCVHASVSPPVLIAGDDAKDARWVSLEALQTYQLTDGTFEVIERILSGQTLSHSVC